MRFALAALMLPLPGCLASKIVATPAGPRRRRRPGDGEGRHACRRRRPTRDRRRAGRPGRNDPPKVTCTKGKGTRTEERTVKAKHLEREVRDMSKDGKVLDVEVAPLD